MTYSISTRNADQTTTNVTADEIIAMLDESIPLQAAHANAIRDLVQNGARYSYEDTDVLGAAFGVAVSKRREVNSYEAKWVERMTAEFAA